MNSTDVTGAASKGQLIKGIWVRGEGQSFYSFNPATLEVIWQGQEASAQQVKSAVCSASDSQYSWALLGLAARVAIVQRFAELLARDSADLAHIISLETGKPLWESSTEVQAMINKVVISIEAQQERAGSRSDGKLQLQHRAHGVVAVFGPYNFPGHLPNGHIVPALLAGNAIVFKPSDQTPWVAEKTAALWLEAGLPEGVLNLVQGGVSVGRALAQADIHALLFTGSSDVGTLLHRELAGRPEVLLALEMGGNNPLIIDTDIELEAAVSIAIQSAYLSAGQRCTCARRLVLVESEQSDRFIEKLAENIDRVIVGAPDAQPEPFMGPLIHHKAVEQLLALEERLSGQGARVLKSMSAQDSKSNFLRPGLIDVTHVEQIEDKEWFGPLLQLHRVSSFAQAVELANNTRYGLAAGLVSDNENHKRDFLAQIKAGVVSINSPTAGASSALPFGGVGASGNHRPSAYYAADYCAWPQAQTLVEYTKDVSSQQRGMKQ